jgi:hypothetical protein
LQNGEKDYFSANLLSKSESNLNKQYRAKSSLHSLSSAKENTDEDSTINRAKTKIVLKRLWPYVILIVIIILLLEWYLYQNKYGDKAGGRKNID